MTFQGEKTTWMWNNILYLLPLLVFTVILIGGAAWFMKKKRPVIGVILLLLAAPVFYYTLFQAPIKITTDVSYDTVPPAHARGDEKSGPSSEKGRHLENPGSGERTGAPPERSSTPGG